jgi:co-chaperonin GroES (HSP10)
MEYTAVNDKVIVKLIDRNKDNQFVRVESRKNTLEEGEVVSIGEKVINVKVGDIILFSAYGYEVWEDEYGILDSDMVFARK